jgi:glycosyltransferase involved in cell wall biosynthesis
MQVELFVSRYTSMIGLARHSEAMEKYLALSGVDYRVVYPQHPFILKAADILLKPLGFDLNTFANTFPVSAQFSKGAVKHFTTQMMASLLTFKPRLGKVVISVHDIVPYMMRDDPDQNQYRRVYDRWIDDWAMKNVRKADRIIAISDYTGRMLVEHLSCPREKIRVVHNGLDHDLFFPLEPSEAFKARYGLSPENRYLLYVGSENPRKNLPRLVQAFALARGKMPNLKLLKIGAPNHPGQYALLQSLISKLGLEDAFIWVGQVPNQDLVSFYNVADAFVFPSLYEGFGLPPLEAMACGTPVICSNSASLPEVTGNAALQVDPLDVDGIAAAIVRLMEDPILREDLRNQGLVWATQFTWAKNIQKTIEVYREVEAIW